MEVLGFGQPVVRSCTVCTGSEGDTKGYMSVIQVR